MQRGVARNGLLYLTDDKMGFQPKGIDALFGARAVSWNLSSMTVVLLKPRLRRLRVTVVTDTGRQRFVVSDAAVVFNDLRSWRLRQVQGTGLERTDPEQSGGAPA